MLIGALSIILGSAKAELTALRIELNAHIKEMTDFKYRLSMLDWTQANDRKSFEEFRASMMDMQRDVRGYPPSITRQKRE